MSAPETPPPATPGLRSLLRRLGPIRRFGHLALVVILLSGPAIFAVTGIQSFATSEANACKAAPYSETPRDWVARRVKLTLDQSLERDGWLNLVAGRDATELVALTADKRKVRLHSASWPVQPKANAELFFYSANEVGDRIERSSDLRSKVSLYHAQWIARNSPWPWDSPRKDGKLGPLAYKTNEAAARQLAIWRVVDGLSIKAYDQRAPVEIRRRAEDLVQLAASYPVKDPELDPGRASLGGWTTRQHDQVVVSADVTTLVGGRRIGLPRQPLTFGYPGGRVLALTDDDGAVCMSLPETIGQMPPTIAVRWERYVPAGSYFVALSSGSTPVAGATGYMDKSRSLSDRRFVGITLNPFRVADELTLPLPPRR